MKKTVCKLVFFCVMICTQMVTALPINCGSGGTRPSGQNQKFKRTYSSSTVNNKTAAKSNTNDNVVITYDDFLSHLQIGRERTTMGTDKPLRMDIGAINSGVKETWVLTDFRNATDFTSILQHHVAPTELDLYEEFGYGTHGVYSDQTVSRDDLYDLNEERLFFVGYEELENGVWQEHRYDQLKAPIPLQLGADYSSVVRFGLDGTDTDLNYVEYTDNYSVIGQGTLKTFDDGDAEAIKLIYKEETREYENGEQVSYSERYELIFYSKRGHYIQADIEDPWNKEGLVDFNTIRYHKLADTSLSIADFSQNDVKIFPNPIAAGETLTIQSKSELGSYSVDFYNIYGQHIKVPSQYENGSKKLQLNIPSDLSKGFYIYKIKSQDGSVVTNGKIQVL